MLGSVNRLLDRLDEEAIDYCHWKSNWAFEETLDGETDIDILVRRSHAPAFRAILLELGLTLSEIEELRAAGVVG